MITFIKDPSAEDVLTIAIIAPEHVAYDNEEVGDEIYGNEEATFGIMTPPCVNIEFKSINENILEIDERLDVEFLIEEVGKSAISKDLSLLNHVFIVDENSNFNEISRKEFVKYLIPGNTIEFVEYEIE